MTRAELLEDIETVESELDEAKQIEDDAASRVASLDEELGDLLAQLDNGDYEDDEDEDDEDEDEEEE